MTQFLDHLFVGLYKAILDKENKVVAKNIPQCFRYLGRFVKPQSYGPFIFQAIRNEIASVYSFTQLGALKAVGYLLAGTIEAFPENYKLDNERFKTTFEDFFDSILMHVIPSLDTELATHLICSLEMIFD